MFKTDNSEQGKGVSVVDRSAFGTSDVQRMGNGVFQSFIQQHEFFDAIMPESAATLRMTTAVDDAGGVSLRACYLRLGRLADTHVKSESNIRIPVSRESGELGSMGFLPSWQPTDVHPDTGVAFNNLKIPQFHDCVSTAKDLHRSVPFVRCIGWDMVVDKNDNIKVMEWNGVHNDIKFSESTQGPCFADLGWEKLWQGCNNRGR